MPADEVNSVGLTLDRPDKENIVDLSGTTESDEVSQTQTTGSIALDNDPAGTASIASGTSDATGHASSQQTATELQRQNLRVAMSDVTASGKSVKAMATYKFWSTQPVMRFDEETKQVEDGPLQILKLQDIPTQPAPLAVAGFEWVTLDVRSDADVKDICELMNGHYVEDADEMFRFNYGTGILKWYLTCPGWKRQWSIGIRATRSRKLVAFISAVPLQLRVRENVLDAAEVNFICVHKKLRSKRLAPVLIKEITRLCNREEVWQAIYTASVVLPKPVSTCRYYHRPLNWQKLYEVGFSHLPSGSKPQYQIRKYSLPTNTSTKGWRQMQLKDVDGVHELLARYLERYDIAPVFTRKEIVHWFVPEMSEGDDQVVWAYVVEDGKGNITDFVSFFSLESTIIGHPKHKVLRAAYLFYYASESGLATPPDRSAHKVRLNQLIGDILLVAMRAKFDVFNALSLMDNALFLEQQKFGRGDGLSHYYLFNYRAAPVRGGIDEEEQLDEQMLSGVGFVNL